MDRNFLLFPFCKVNQRYLLLIELKKPVFRIQPEGVFLHYEHWQY